MIQYHQYMIEPETGKVFAKDQWGALKEKRPNKDGEVLLTIDGKFEWTNVASLTKSLSATLNNPEPSLSNVANVAQKEPVNVASPGKKGKERPSTQGEKHHNYKGPVTYKGIQYTCAAEAAKACGVHRSTVKRALERL